MSTTVRSVLEKIKCREAKVGIIGLGYVGIPLALRFCDEGYSVLGIDVDSRKIDSLNRGISYIEHIPSEAISRAREQRFSASVNFSAIANLDVIIICVPTPLNQYREPDMSFVKASIDSIAPFLRAGHTVSLESTTYPGTTEELIVPAVEARGLKVGEDVFVVFSPEREDPGRKDFSTKTTPKVCGGISAACLEVGTAVYAAIVDRVVQVSSTKAAELTKLLENIHRAVNIGLVNEMKLIAQRMGIDIYEVIDAAATKPFGFVPYYPGPGLGGHCIPIDPFYLTWKAREFGINAKFIELAGEINSSMPHFVIERITHALNTESLALKGSKILVLGVAYKKNVDDFRESPALEIIQLLLEKGAELSYSDPHVPSLELKHKEGKKINYKSVGLTAAALGRFDCVVLVTDHSAFDFQLIAQNSRLLVDTRGVFRKLTKKFFQA